MKLRVFTTLIAALMILSSVLVANAVTLVGDQNKDITLTVTYNPTSGAPGTKVTGSASIKNNTKSNLTVTLSVTTNVPGYTHESITVTLKAGATYSIGPISEDLPSDTPLGTYTATVSASDSHGASSVTGSFTVN